MRTDKIPQYTIHIYEEQIKSQDIL